MPRARNIKPGFFENEHLGVLPGDIQLLFAALWTLADREGIVECRVSKIRTYAFRYRQDITDDMLNGYLTVLARLDLGKMLRRVLYKDCEYLIIQNFDIHQTPHHTEKKGKLPSLVLLKGAETLTCRDLTVISRFMHRENPPDSLIPDSLIPDSLIPDSLIPDSRPPDDYEKEFQQFKISFPLQGRGFGNGKDAKAKFIIARKKDSFENIMSGVTKYANYIRTTGQDNRDAFRWLEKEQWRDDYTVNPRKQQPTTNDNFTAGCELFLSQDVE